MAVETVAEGLHGSFQLPKGHRWPHTHSEAERVDKEKGTYLGRGLASGLDADVTAEAAGFDHDAVCCKGD